VLLGVALVVAVGAVSASAFVFQGRDDTSSSRSSKPRTHQTTRRNATTTSTSTAGSFCDGTGSGVIDAMNGDRAANGLGSLCGNAQLQGLAQNWANWMAQNLSLTHQDIGSAIYSTPFYSMAENILDGPAGMSVGEMESAWMQSPGHRENILGGAYGAAGVGIAYSSDGRVWVAVDFGG
jgi:uncharacterized protein YkwD